DCAATRPGLDHATGTVVLCVFCFLQQVKVYERTFPYGTSHQRLPLLLGVARTDDHLIRALVVAGTSALGRLAPRRNWVTATRGTAFTPPVRVVDRGLSDTARQRLYAHPTATTGLGQRLVGVVRVRNRANSAHAIAAQVTLLTRVQANDYQAAVTANELHISASRASDLTALARLHFDVVAD